MARTPTALFHVEHREALDGPVAVRSFATGGHLARPSDMRDVEISRELDGLSCTLHSGRSVSPAMLPAVLPVLFGVLPLVLKLGRGDTQDLFVAGLFLVLAVMIGAIGLVLGSLVSSPHYGSVRLDVRGGALRITHGRWLRPDVRFRGLTPTEVLPLDELVDAWAGTRKVKEAEVGLLVLRLRGNRYIELPAAHHDEAAIEALAEELKALGRAAESREGEVPEAIEALRAARQTVKAPQ